MKYITMGLAVITLFVGMNAAAAFAQSNPPLFGPDTVTTGVFTGRGISRRGLSCDLPPASATPLTCTGFLAGVDGTLLDVTVRVPQSEGIHPLVVGLHGWGNSKKEMAQYDERMAMQGYTFLRYSARGFGDSWGVVNLADIHVEIADLKGVIGQVIDDPRLQADPASVGIFGISYGGGQTWLTAAEPSWTTPGGKLIQVRTLVPIVPWSDLLYALRPNGRVFDPVNVPGSPKLSYIEGLYLSGIRHSPNRPYPNYPPYLTVWNAYLAAVEPNRTDPLGRQLVNGLEGYRSIYWQPAFWNRVADNSRNGTTQLPVLEIQGWTDDLFPVPEALRMYQTLKSIDPDYPIAEYFGDIGHPRAANKPGEVEYIFGLIDRWFAFYLKGEGPPPPLNVQAAITRAAAAPFNPDDVLQSATYEDLADEAIPHHFSGSALLTFNPVNTSGFVWDPLLLAGSEALSPNPPSPPSDVVPGDIALYRVPISQLVDDETFLIAGEPTVTLTFFTLAYREAINVRLFDLKPDGSRELITRGTYTVDTGRLLVPIGNRTITIPTYGNVWQANTNDILELEITHVDSPYIAPSKIPSITHLSNVKLNLPLRR